MRVTELIARWNALPFASVDDVFAGAAPLVLAPHPDDESLGCGGIIASCCARGRTPSVVIVTDGAASHPGSRRWPPDALRALRERETEAATGALGLPRERLHFLRRPDAAAPRRGPGFETTVAAICSIAARDRCGAVLATWGYDPHCDHEAVAEMATAASDRLGVPLYFYPVWGWTLPPEQLVGEGEARGWRVRIDDQLPAKREAVAAHRSQMTDLIADATTPWHLPEELRRIFDRPFEVLLRPA